MPAATPAAAISGVNERSGSIERRTSIAPSSTKPTIQGHGESSDENALSMRTTRNPVSATRTETLEGRAARTSSSKKRWNAPANTTQTATSSHTRPGVHSTSHDHASDDRDRARGGARRQHVGAVLAARSIARRSRGSGSVPRPDRAAARGRRAPRSRARTRTERGDPRPRPSTSRGARRFLACVRARAQPAKPNTRANKPRMARPSSALSARMRVNTQNA